MSILWRIVAESKEIKKISFRAKAVAEAGNKKASSDGRMLFC